MTTLAEVLMLVGAIGLLASFLFDITDIGDGLGGVSLFGLAAGATVSGVLLWVFPALWWLAIVAGLGTIVIAALVQRTLKSSATGPLPELESVIGTELTLTTGTDAAGRNGIASLDVGGVGTIVLVDSDTPIPAGQKVWVREVTDHGSRVRVEPII